MWGDLRFGEDVFIQRLDSESPSGTWERNYIIESCGPALQSFGSYCADGNTTRVDGVRVTLTNDIDTSDIPRSQEEVRLTADMSGVWVVYEDQIPDDIPSLDIFVQHFNLQGNPTFNDGGIPVSSANILTAASSSFSSPCTKPPGKDHLFLCGVIFLLIKRTFNVFSSQSNLKQTTLTALNDNGNLSPMY